MRVDCVEVDVADLILDERVPDSDEAGREDTGYCTDRVNADTASGEWQQGHGDSSPNDSRAVNVRLRRKQTILNPVK